ncbi:hypothetical protein ACFQV4_28380 [Streptomyces thermocarboxydus]
MSEQLLRRSGHEVALYTVRDGRMYLLWEDGYPQHFLDPFEGCRWTPTCPACTR